MSCSAKEEEEKPACRPNHDMRKNRTRTLNCENIVMCVALKRMGAGQMTAGGAMTDDVEKSVGAKR